MGAEKIPPTQAEALARRIRDALGPFNDPNEPVQSLVEKLAERALSAAPPSESAPAEGVGEVELLAIRVEATARHIRACPVYDKLRGDADDMDAAAALIRQQASAYDALAAERDRLRESLHYANGTAELAMKHRDAAEAARIRRRATQSGGDAEVVRFSIQVEKLLCDALGRTWSASGISIESLVADLKARATATEAARDAAVGVLREARSYVSTSRTPAIAKRVDALLARIDTLLTEASREG